MPSKSGKQHRLMALVANDPKAAKRLGISQKVGEDFMKADKGRKFGSGGSMKESKAMMKKEVSFMKKKGAPASMIKHEEREMKGVKKMAGGGTGASKAQNFLRQQAMPAGRGMQGIGSQRASNSPFQYTPNASRAGQASNTKDYVKQGMASGLKPGTPAFSKYISDMPNLSQSSTDEQKADAGMKKGGMAGSYRRAADGVASKGKTKGHVVKMREGGSVGGSYRRAADGIASKGKTKGKMVKMRMGGSCG